MYEGMRLMFHEEALYVPLPLLNLKVILEKWPLKRCVVCVCVCVCVCHLVRSAEIKKTDPFGVRLCQTRLDLFVRETVLFRRCCGCGGVVDGTVRRRSDTAAAVISWRFQRLRVILAPAQHHSSGVHCSFCVR